MSGNMTIVTREEFYARIFDGKLNVHPRSEREVTYWEFPNRTLFGTSKGYAVRGDGEFRVREGAAP